MGEQSEVHINDKNGLAWTASGCPKCDWSFRLTYSLASDRFTPARCPECDILLKPPERLLEAAKRLQGSSLLAVPCEGPASSPALTASLPRSPSTPSRRIPAFLMIGSLCTVLASFFFPFYSKSMPLLESVGVSLFDVLIEDGNFMFLICFAVLEALAFITCVFALQENKVHIGVCVHANSIHRLSYVQELY